MIGEQNGLEVRSLRALRAAKGNQSQAARLLQVSRDQLRYRVKRYRELGKLSPGLVSNDMAN